MKIEIDLKEILTDEFGDTTNLAQTIKAEIIKKLSEELSKGIKDKITQDVAKLIDDEIKRVVACQMPSLLSELIDTEYTEIDKWGVRKGTTTVRNMLIKTLTEQMIYKAERYDSDKNFFTRNIDAIIAEKTELFKKQFNQKVDEIFVKEALKYASEKLRKTLNIE